MVTTGDLISLHVTLSARSAQMSRKIARRPLGLFILGILALPAAHAGGSADTQSIDNANPARGHHSNQEKAAHAPEVKHSIVINAKPQHVWAAIQHQRKADASRKLLSYDGTAATLHETFGALPIVGEASCDYVENEKASLQRIDYSMLKSDRFHVFQGSWILSPGKNMNSTVVELSNEIDPGIRVPFWQDITKVAATRLVKRRLEAVCAYAEELQKSENSKSLSSSAGTTN